MLLVELRVSRTSVRNFRSRIRLIQIKLNKKALRKFRVFVPRLTDPFDCNCVRLLNVNYIDNLSAERSHLVHKRLLLQLRVGAHSLE